MALHGCWVDFTAVADARAKALFVERPERAKLEGLAYLDATLKADSSAMPRNGKQRKSNGNEKNKDKSNDKKATTKKQILRLRRRMTTKRQKQRQGQKQGEKQKETMVRVSIGCGEGYLFQDGWG
jgi:hypothetical protein